MAAAVSQKRLMIDKASQRVIIATSAAAFVVVFCLVASHTLYSQMTYQNHVIKAKKAALTQLKQDKAAVATLDTAYTSFVSSPQNIIGGSASGTGDKDGDNAKIVLDALPSKYDFPALTTSLEKLTEGQGLTIQSIGGTDDEVAQSSNTTSAVPKAIPIPFQLKAKGNYQNVENLLVSLEASIRPMQVQAMTLTGDNNNLTVSLTAQTFYQPGKTFTIGKTEVK